MSRLVSVRHAICELELVPRSDDLTSLPEHPVSEIVDLGH